MVWFGSGSFIKWAITTLNHFEVVALAQHTVGDGSPIAALVLAGTCRILWPELGVKLPIHSLLLSFHREGVSRPHHFVTSETIGTLAALKTGESRANRVCRQSQHAHQILISLRLEDVIGAPNPPALV